MNLRRIDDVNAKFEGMKE